jgi:hypothetical protein
VLEAVRKLNTQLQASSFGLKTGTHGGFPHRPSSAESSWLPDESDGVLASSS